MNPDSDRENTSPRRDGGTQDVRILVWNVRGTGKRNFLQEFKEHVPQHKPQIVALLETHISGVQADEVCRRSGYDSWHRSEAIGFQGGIWILWNGQDIVINNNPFSCTICYNASKTRTRNELAF